jgi:hypothetical protein
MKLSEFAFSKTFGAIALIIVLTNGLNFFDQFDVAPSDD